MLPDRVSNPGPLIYESGALPIALRGPAHDLVVAVVGKGYLYGVRQQRLGSAYTSTLSG